MKNKLITLLFVTAAVLIIPLAVRTNIAKFINCEWCGVEFGNELSACTSCGYCTNCDWEVFGVVRCTRCDMGADCVSQAKVGWCVACFECEGCCRCKNFHEAQGSDWTRYGLLDCRGCSNDGLTVSGKGIPWCDSCSHCGECCSCD